MPSALVPVAILLSLGAAGAAPQASESAKIIKLAQLTFRQRIVIRVPRLPEPRDLPSASAPAKDPRWHEKKGPKCVPIPLIAGASVTRADSVDLVTVDDDVLRAHLDEKCPALDFYQGFYMRQTPDGQVCAGRDSLRSRSGGVCQIKSFKRLIRKR